MNDTAALETRLATAAIACGCATLLLRPALMARLGGVALIVVVFTSLLVIGLCAPVPADTTYPTLSAAGAFAIGVAAFVLARFVVGGDAVAAALPRVVALNAFAAIAEEAFFRRLVYGRLVPRGPAVAVAGSAALFAVVHVTVYGWWVLPIDLAAGLLFSWQRRVTGDWRVPALTHVLANTLAVI